VTARRPDLIEPLRRALAAGVSVKDLHAHDSKAFDALATVVGAAYLTEPRVQRLLGYPGRRALPAGYSEAEAMELGELVRPVQERGFASRGTAGGAGAT